MNPIPLFKVYMSPTAAVEASKVLNSGYIGQGPKVDDFEHDLKSFFNPYWEDIITFNSATSAEHMLYHMLKTPRNLDIKVDNTIVPCTWYGFGEDDEVLTTPLTCTATNWPIILNDLNIKWIDVDPNTFNIDLEDLERKINHNTRIIQIVHWGGYPVDMDKLMDIVRTAEHYYGRKILVIEDCAHAFGSKYYDKYVGFSGNFSTFSTQAIKHITSVDGGFLVSPFSQFSKEARLLRWYGIDRDSSKRSDFRCEGDIPEIGFKFHQNDVNATIGIENLKMAEWIIGNHKYNGQYYNKALQGVDGVTLLNNDSWADSSYWLYSMKVERRDDFMKMMTSKGITVSRVHERNDKHSCVWTYKTDLPKLESFIDNMICIPVGWWLEKSEIVYIVECIKEGW